MNREDMWKREVDMWKRAYDVALYANKVLERKLNAYRAIANQRGALWPKGPFIDEAANFIMERDKPNE
jgi:hypothetical protein